MAETRYSVPTAFCDHCRETLHKAVGRLAGVREVRVDLPSQIVAVDYDDSLLEEEAIHQRIEGAGYPCRPA